MRIKPALIGTLAICHSVLAYAQSDSNSMYERQCEIVDGVVVCKSLEDRFSGLAPQQRGEALYGETDNKHGPMLGYGGPGYGDSQTRLTAVITNNNGEQHTREVRMKYLENTPDGNMRMVVFDYPRDLKRHALLTISHKEGYDEQWSYDPDTKQVSRMLSNNAFTPFSGTEIAFEDISSQDFKKYTYEYVREDSFEGKPVQVVNRYPKDRYSGYSRLETWLDAQTNLIKKIDYYDRSNTLLKTLILNEYNLYDEKYWRASEMLMTNHQNGRDTRLTWSDYRFNTGLDKNDFSLNSLRNID